MGERQDLEAAAATLEQNFVLIEAEIASMDDVLAMLSTYSPQCTSNSERDSIYDYLRDLKKARFRNRIAYGRIVEKLDPFGDLYLFTPGDPVLLSPYGVIPRVTGYSRYADEASVQSLSTASPVVLTISPTVIDEAQKPADVSTFLQAGIIRGLEADALEVQIEMNVRATDPVETATVLAAWIAIGSDLVTKVMPQELPLDGYDLVRPVVYKMSAYVGAAWATDGARLVVESNGPVEITQRTLSVTRLHKGRRV